MARKRTRRSHRRLMAQRALAMLAALQEGERSRTELIAEVSSQVGDNAYGDSPVDSFENDKKFLHDLDFSVLYDRRANAYRLKNEAHSLLRLSLTHEELEALAILGQAFAATPYEDAISQLLKRIRSYLSPAQREQEPAPMFNLVMANIGKLAPHVQTIRKIQQAMKSRQWLEFEYRALRTGEIRRHTVQVYNNLEWRDGHVYFEAFYKNWKILDYRVDRIVPNSVKILPGKFPEGQRKPIVLPLRYRLLAEVARYGASRRFPEHREERQADGSLIVSAQIAKDDLFWASKVLLKYGENCVVLEPPELVKEMRRIVKEMAANYHRDM